MDALPIEPLFVNREAELAQLERTVGELDRGVRHHLALLGLRRIGKTLLLDEMERRHPRWATARLDADAVASEPEDFVRALIGAVLRAALRARGDARYVPQTDDGLYAAAGAVALDLIAPVDEALAHLAAGRAGLAIAVATQIPAETARAIGQGLVVMIDEFQEIDRLAAAGASNVLGAFRAALDRPGRTLFVVAGSRVTAMRRLVEDSDSPLFTRFTTLAVPPFDRAATHELAGRVWEDRPHTTEAADRLHRLTGGWPFYVHAVAARAAALTLPRTIDPDAVDVAYQSELIGRSGNVALHCQYLLRTATATSDTARRNLAERLLRRVAREPGIPRARLARALIGRHAKNDVYQALNELIAEDFVVEVEGTLRLADPVFAVWLTVEADQSDPLRALGQPGAVARLIARYEAQHQADRTEMGHLFEMAVENTVRQFKGQIVPGRLLGTAEDVRLPMVDDARPARLDDPRAAYGEHPDSYEVDVVTTGPAARDRWAIECKHRNSSVTRPMVERFLTSVRVIETVSGQPFAARWIVSSRGIRSDAAAHARAEGVLYSGKRELEALARRLAGIGRE